MASTIRGSDNMDSAGVEEGKAKAWVNFNGTGTVAIRDSFNVSSITDNGAGDYLVNLTNAMPDANYCAVATTEYFNVAAVASTAAGVIINNADNTPVLTDAANVYIVVFDN